MEYTKITEQFLVNGNGRDVILDGFDFTGNGFVKVTDAASLTIRNCRVYGLTLAAGKNYWLFVDSKNPIKLVVEHCYFGDSVAEGGVLYNFIEPHVVLADGSKFSHNYFTAKCCTHNTINLYGAAEQSKIDVSSNVFEMSAGTVRVGVQGEPVCEITMDDNVIYAENPAYGPADQGLVTVQPYGKLTSTFANMTLLMNNNICPSEQLLSGYYGANDTVLTNENMPKIVVNGTAIVAPIYH